MWGDQALNSTASQVGGGTVSNSRRPVSAISAAKSGIPTADKAYLVANVSQLKWATLDELDPDPSRIPTTANSSLDYVGRNHGGPRHLGTVPGPNGPVTGWDQRTSNFLYVDGHVETKNLAATLAGGRSEWGDQFYSMSN